MSRNNNGIKNQSAVDKIAQSVSFSAKSLDARKPVSKERARYIKEISSRALLAVTRTT